MNDQLLNKLESLKLALEKDERIIGLNLLDEKMNKNEEVMALAYKKDMAALDFEDALKHFGEKAKETQVAQKRLYEAKLSLDTHPLVKEYNEAYKEVKILYNKINDELFKDFSSQKCGEF